MADVALVASTIGHWRVAVAMSQVRSIESTTVTVDDGEVYDVGRACLDVDAPTEDRRIVVAQPACGGIRVRVGADVRIEALPLDAMLEVPAFLGGLRARAAVTGLFEAAGKLGYLIDLSRLAALAAQSRGDA